MGPSVSTSFLPPLSLFPICPCLQPPPFLILPLCSFTARPAGVSQGKPHSTTYKHFPCILRFLNKLPTHFYWKKKKKRRGKKFHRESEKRHHIPQPSASPGRLRGIFSHTAQNALLRAERPHTLYHYHANREWSEQSYRKKERRGSYRCFHFTWGSHLNIRKICRKRPKVDIPGRNNVKVGSGESFLLTEHNLCRRDSPSSRMCCSKDCKTLSKSELLSPGWFVHRKYKPRKSESNTAWFRFPKTTYSFNSNFSSMLLIVLQLYPSMEFSLLTQFQPSVYAENLISKEWEESSVQKIPPS